jgi:hypothetical protein
MRFKNRAELDMASRAGVFAGGDWTLCIEHDDACSPSNCVCEPSFTVLPLDPRTLKLALEKDAAWRRETSS